MADRRDVTTREKKWKLQVVKNLFVLYRETPPPKKKNTNTERMTIAIFQIENLSFLIKRFNLNEKKIGIALPKIFVRLMK